MSRLVVLWLRRGRVRGWFGIEKCLLMDGLRVDAGVGIAGGDGNSGRGVVQAPKHGLSGR